MIVSPVGFPARSVTQLHAYAAKTVIGQVSQWIDHHHRL